MLPFKIHQFRLRKAHYLLLPKLNSEQLMTLRIRLEREGYAQGVSEEVFLRPKTGVVRISPSGLCRSSFDAADLILPVVPEILASGKERVPARDLTAKYFAEGGGRNPHIFRISTRMESFSLWTELRRTDGCALAPDEHAVASLLISRSRGCRLVTDFPVVKSRPVILGRKRYFDSTLPSIQALSTLRVVGTRGSRNSYLARDGFLRLSGFSPPTRSDLVSTYAAAGDWCAFTPS